MLRIYLITFFSFIAHLNILNVFANEKEIDFKFITTKDLEWEYADPFLERPLYWKKLDDKENFEVLIKKINNRRNNKIFSVRSIGKGVSVNGSFYPDISNYVPNAFVEDPNKNFGLSSRGISKTRFCDGKNFSNDCSDGVLDFDFKLFNNDDFSIYPKFNIQSLTNRGTNLGEGLSLGVKLAKRLSPEWSIAFGGENIVHFDETIDLGHNFFVVASTYLPINSEKKSSILFLNAGIGSDFYGYRGNGFLFRTNCLGKNTITGKPDNPNSCSWGPIASAALAFNDRFSIVSEWFGYSYGAGFSIRPFKEKSLNLSFYATDFIQGFPKYAKDLCPENVCTTRFYGSISLHF